jgi:hypothetical protein
VTVGLWLAGAVMQRRLGIAAALGLQVFAIAVALIAALA